MCIPSQLGLAGALGCKGWLKPGIVAMGTVAFSWHSWHLGELRSPPGAGQSHPGSSAHPSPPPATLRLWLLQELMQQFVPPTGISTQGAKPFPQPASVQADRSVHACMCLHVSPHSQ